MAIAQNSPIYLQAYGHYLGVGANWEASIMLKGASPASEDAFFLELAEGRDQLCYDEEFFLRAYNQRYVVKSNGVLCAFGREKKDASSFRILPVNSGKSEPCSSGESLLLYSGTDPILIPSLEGGGVTANIGALEATPVTLLCVGDEITKNQDKKGMEDEIKNAHDDEWMDEEDLALLDEESPNIVYSADVTEDDEDITTHLMTEVKPVIPIATTIVHQRDDKISLPKIATPRSENIIDSSISTLSLPIFDPVRDRLEDHLRQLLEARRIECRLADECQQLLERCEQLQSSIPRLSQLAERRIQLQQSLDQFLEVIPEDSRRLFGTETQISKKIDQILPVYTGYKDELSITLQNSFSEFQTLLSQIGQLQADLELKKSEIEQAGAEAEAMRGELRPYLEANQRIAAFLPGAQNVMDLLREVERLLRESDRLLEDLLP